MVSKPEKPAAVPQEEARIPHIGGYPLFNGSSNAVVIRRVDVLRVHDYARQNCDLRDYLLIRLGLKIGLRTGEICTLRIENINFEDRNFNVLDSKRKVLYPLPLDQVTLQLIQDHIGERTEGYVFTQKCSWMHAREDRPLTRSTVWFCMRSIAAKVGVKGFKPRILRQFFAADWAMQHKNLEVLRRILRHRSLAYTQIYVSKLVFWEDVQNEYDGIQNAPFTGNIKAPPIQTSAAEPLLSSFYQQHCISCDHVHICKLIDQTPPWATGCLYYVPMSAPEAGLRVITKT
jgi:hypothetical protein